MSRHVAVLLALLGLALGQQGGSNEGGCWDQSGKAYAVGSRWTSGCSEFRCLPGGATVSCQCVTPRAPQGCQVVNGTGSEFPWCCPRVQCLGQTGSRTGNQDHQGNQGNHGYQSYHSNYGGLQPLQPPSGQSQYGVQGGQHDATPYPFDLASILKYFTPQVDLSKMSTPPDILSNMFPQMGPDLLKQGMENIRALQPNFDLQSPLNPLSFISGIMGPKDSSSTNPLQFFNKMSSIFNPQNSQSQLGQLPSLQELFPLMNPKVMTPLMDSMTKGFEQALSIPGKLLSQFLPHGGSGNTVGSPFAGLPGLEGGIPFSPDKLMSMFQPQLPGQHQQGSGSSSSHGEVADKPQFGGYQGFSAPSSKEPQQLPFSQGASHTSDQSVRLPFMPGHDWTAAQTGQPSAAPQGGVGNRHGLEWSSSLNNGLPFPDLKGGADDKQGRDGSNGQHGGAANSQHGQQGGASFGLQGGSGGHSGNGLFGNFPNLMPSFGLQGGKGNGQPNGQHGSTSFGMQGGSGGSHSGYGLSGNLPNMMSPFGLQGGEGNGQPNGQHGSTSFGIQGGSGGGHSGNGLFGNFPNLMPSFGLQGGEGNGQPNGQHGSTSFGIQGGSGGGHSGNALLGNLPNMTSSFGLQGGEGNGQPNNGQHGSTSSGLQGGSGGHSGNGLLGNLPNLMSSFGVQDGGGNSQPNAQQGSASFGLHGGSGGGQSGNGLLGGLSTLGQASGNGQQGQPGGASFGLQGERSGVAEGQGGLEGGAGGDQRGGSSSFNPGGGNGYGFSLGLNGGGRGEAAGGGRGGQGAGGSLSFGLGR